MFRDRSLIVRSRAGSVCACLIHVSNRGLAAHDVTTDEWSKQQLKAGDGE